MRVMIERVAGLDVHQETVVACVLIGKPAERPAKEVRTFRTMTRDLEALREWLLSLGVTHVGMESTRIYWKPVYAVLEGRFVPPPPLRELRDLLLSPEAGGKPSG